MDRQERKAARIERAKEMAEKYMVGATLAEIGDYYGITRERVRQLLSRELGITGKDGGRSRRAKEKKESAATRRDLKHLRLYGMTASEFRGANRRLDQAGKKPVHRFRMQRSNSRRRGIDWKLTFAEWWLVWHESGKWDERGRGGYVMARHSDSGAYERGNVKIIKAGENNSEYIRRYWIEVKSGKRPWPRKPRKATKD